MKSSHICNVSALCYPNDFCLCICVNNVAVASFNPVYRSKIKFNLLIVKTDEKASSVLSSSLCLWITLYMHIYLYHRTSIQRTDKGIINLKKNITDQLFFAKVCKTYNHVYLLSCQEKQTNSDSQQILRKCQWNHFRSCFWAQSRRNITEDMGNVRLGSVA